ncbi:hypothetical protein JHS3_21610 [Jeongeupia sp. HS-3]|uniref:hypothetical protein n=1 Tax=Jeongeupia sp. HS-3 TaxID=1009682 RepID=UPI0018A3A4FD|nr:hypothetical protein [Jeongeupia sp. HS-3]BCL76425.1 hypothetical protein JHS3_21610 [Jeongeupia sp. HS-3]
MSRLALSTALLCLAVFSCPPAIAAKGGSLPSHFGDRLEAALSCRGEWSTDYWQGYLRKHLGKPLRNWGGADWFDARNADLAGVAAQEVFINPPQSGTLIVGALIAQPIDAVRARLEERLGMRFQSLPGPYPRYLSATGSVLVGVANRQTKWYCARWDLGNRA